MHQHQPQSARYKKTSSKPFLSQTPVRVGFAFAATTLAGVLLFGINGLISDQQAYQDLRSLDQLNNQIVQCRFWVSDLQQRWVELNIDQNLQAHASLIRTQAKRMSVQATQIDTCLNQVPVQVLSPQEEADLSHIQKEYRQFLSRSAWLSNLDHDVEMALLPNALAWEPQIQQDLIHLVSHLTRLAEHLQQRTDTLYSQQFQENRRNHIMILVFGSTTALIMLGLTAITVKLVNKQTRLLHKLELLARTDGLTGIANRRVWDEELSRALERARRSRQPIAVAILDLDYFKRFNDSYGHQAGDALLRDFARLLKSKLREGDVVARYGGEEFGMLLHGCKAEKAAEVIARIRSFVPYDQTFSAGITESDGFESGATVVGRADSALYEAKDQGRNRSTLLFRDRLKLPPKPTSSKPRNQLK